MTITTKRPASSGTKSVAPRKPPQFPDENAKGMPDPRSWLNVETLLKWLDVEIRRNELTGEDEVDGKVISDDIMHGIMDAAHRNDLRLNRDFLLERMKIEALQNKHHPIRDYMKKLKWDRDERLDSWLVDYFGADDNEYTRAVGALTLIAAVRRMKKPGTKFDTMLILEGTQGTGKSSALAALAVEKEWFTDCVSLTDDSKVLIEQTAGKWLIEIPELSGMKRADVEHVKANLSRTSDRARKAYDRLPTEVARQFILIGTANVDDAGKAAYLKDHTGNRRFWPVTTGDIDLAGLSEDCDQLWAEAVVREARGDPITLDPRLWAHAERRQKARMEEDPYYINLRDEIGDKAGKILLAQIWAFLGKKTASVTQADLERTGRALRKLGWRRIRRRHHGELKYMYVKGDEPYEIVRLNML